MRKFFISLIFGFVCLTFVPKIVKAQIVINEVLNNPVGEESGAEWVELYNKADTPTSLKDCTLLLDDTSTTQKVVFGNEDFVEKYKTVTWDHSWLNNSGDLVKLKCPSGEESIAYGNVSNSVIDAPQEGKTFGRYPDGNGTFVLLSSVTLKSANTGPFVPSATAAPTNSPTVTQKPTATPKATITLKPTMTEKPTPTIAPTVSHSSNITSTSSNTPTEFNETETPVSVTTSDTSTPKPTHVEAKVLGTKTTNKIPPLSILFMALGVLVICPSLLLVIKNIKSRYTMRDETKSD